MEGFLFNFINIKNRSHYFLLILFFTLGSYSFGAKFAEDATFGKTILANNEFKNAIAFIELHKTRYGEYPESLSDLKHIS